MQGCIPCDTYIYIKKDQSPMEWEAEIESFLANHKHEKRGRR